jgi:hypothetical protein
MKLKQLILAIGLLVSSLGLAQRVRVGGGLGFSAYYGDLIAGTPVLNEVVPALNLTATYDLRMKLRARLGLSILGAKADDRFNKRQDLKDRNLSFKTSIWETTLQAEYDFVSREEFFMVPYVVGGVGVFGFSPTAIDANGQKVKLWEWNTEGQGLPGHPAPYKRVGINMNLGMGIRYELTDEISVGAEVIMRKTTTDYIDDVSGRYPDFLETGINPDPTKYRLDLSYRGTEVGKPFPGVSMPRGNPKRNDAFYSFQFTFIYRLSNLQIGGDLDFYGSSGYGRRRTRNPRYVL